MNIYSYIISPRTFKFGPDECLHMALEPGSPGEYAVWLLALVGVWALASPFVYGDTVSGAAANNYLGVGLVVLALSAFVTSRVRS